MSDGIVQVETGGCYTAAIDHEGRLLTWGMNRSGQCGHGGTDFIEVPTLIEALPSRVVDVSCGFQHTGAVDEDGHLWTWGKAQQGQLGRDFPADGAPDKLPEKVGESVFAGAGELPPFASVACGFNSTYGLTTEGDVYSCGFGPQLGLGSKENVAVPRRIDLQGAKAKSIVCGQKHAAVLTEDGEVMVWGANTQRQLGEGCANLQLKPAKLEVLGEGDRTLKALRVVAGWYHTAIFAEDGKLYIYGDGEVGEAAASSVRGVSTAPLLECQGVKDIAFGWKHALVIADGLE